MGNEVFRKGPLSSLRPGLAPLLFTAAVIALVMAGLRQAEAAGRAEGRRLLEEGLNAAVLRCYVTEGSYPGSLAYIEERYGVFIDESKYTVRYRITGANVRPGITVIEK